MKKSKSLYHWVQVNHPNAVLWLRYVQDVPGEPRHHFGDVYRRPTGPLESRIYRASGDQFEIHRSLSEAKEYVEKQQREEGVK